MPGSSRCTSAPRETKSKAPLGAMFKPYFMLLEAILQGFRTAKKLVRQFRLPRSKELLQLAFTPLLRFCRSDGHFVPRIRNKATTRSPAPMARPADNRMVGKPTRPK